MPQCSGGGGSTAPPVSALLKPLCQQEHGTSCGVGTATAAQGAVPAGILVRAGNTASNRLAGQRQGR